MTDVETGHAGRPSGWWRSRDGVAYPPEPWHLGGTLLVSTFALAAGALPDALHRTLPPGRRPFVVRGRATVATAFARYSPGGVLQYDELLVGVLSLDRGAPRCTIPQIWVDSPASRAGGRELWGIPKELGQFARTPPDATGAAEVAMGLDGRPVATLSAVPGRRMLPGRRRLPLETVQHLDGRTVASRNLLLGRVERLQATWTFDPGGPLGYLAGARPRFSAALRDAVVVFGMDVQRR